MSEHTQGRLTSTHPLFNEGAQLFLYSESNQIVAHIGNKVSGRPLTIEDAENARRLEACWNVCEGLSTEVLESILMMGDTMKSRFAMRDKVELDMTAQRDELLQALKLCEGNISSLLASQHPKVFGSWLEVVRSAIAKATGDKK